MAKKLDSFKIKRYRGAESFRAIREFSLAHEQPVHCSREWHERWHGLARAKELYLSGGERQNRLIELFFSRT